MNMGYKFDTIPKTKLNGEGYIKIRPHFKEDFQEIRDLIKGLYCVNHVENDEEHGIIYACFNSKHDELEVLETINLLKSHMRHLDGLVTNKQLLDKISNYPVCRHLLIEALEAIEVKKDIMTGLDKIRKILEYLWKVAIGKQNKSLENITEDEFGKFLGKQGLNQSLVGLYIQSIKSFMRFQDDLIKHNIDLKKITDKDILACKNLGLFLIDCVLQNKCI